MLDSPDVEDIAKFVAMVASEPVRKSSALGRKDTTAAKMNISSFEFGSSGKH